VHLLLDVDGVLVPFPARDHSTPATHTPHLVHPTGHPGPVRIWLDPGHGPLIARALGTGLFTPVWCTSWRQDASALIGPLLGLPPFGHIDLPRLPLTTSHPDGYLWKRDHVAHWLSAAPLVWIDDDFTALDHAWAAHRTAAGLPTLLIQPDPRVGLRPEHLAAATAWASALTTPTEAT
jgi:hypothetical protein